jgi:phosphate transport system ATP-binding protein
MEEPEQNVATTSLPKPAALQQPSEAPVSDTPGAHVFNTKNVSCYYGSFRAVTDVSLTIYENEITAFIGPSGCGKTTVLRTLNRMNDLIPSARVEGDVHYRGASLYASGVSPTAVRRRIGMVFQKPNPFPTMSIFENVASGLRLSSPSRGRHAKAALHAKVEQALRSAGLWDEVSDRLSEPGAGLSGGQQQRLCIARSLAVDPDVILMDEPCSALDPIATLKIEELIGRLKARVTIVIVTHNMQQAARVADRTAFVLDGRLVEIGPTLQLFTTPTDSRTEEYVTGKFG